jgi:8-amino-7-oxononanoate synthase
MTRVETRLAADLAGLAAQRRGRRRRTVEARERGGTRVRVDGRDVLAFCSNDYLGLADHPSVVDACIVAARTWGVGATASHLVNGHTLAHEALETSLAALVDRPRAVVFSSGYLANLAIAAVLARRGDLVLEDRLNHASLLDAGLASGARFARYAHADVAAMRSRLGSRRDSDRASLVLTDGVFSMDGDIAPLRELATACRETGATLVVDDAHGFGVLGPHGAGSVEDARLAIDDVPVLMCTLGKALGSAGAFVAGTEAVIESLVQRARTYIYTTALPAPIAAATHAALDLVRAEPWRREAVLDHARRFREGAATLGLALLPSRTPIQPLVLGGNDTALEASAALFDAGVWVPAIRPPTVPAGRSRLRFTFSAAHRPEDIDRLLETLQRLQRRGQLPGADGA